MANSPTISVLLTAVEEALAALKAALSIPITPLPVPVPDALADRTQIGTLDGNPLYVLAYQGIWLMSSPEPGVYMIHGANLPANPKVILTTKLPLGIQGGMTRNIGRDQPESFPVSIPGYTAGAYLDKAKYFKKASTDPAGTTPVPSPLPGALPDPDAQNATTNDQPLSNEN